MPWEWRNRGSPAEAGQQAQDALLVGHVRLRELPLLLIAPLGLAAALLTHVLLQAGAVCRFVAPRFAERAHAAVEPVMFLEIALALWFAGFALCDALTTRAQPVYKIGSPLRLGIGHLSLSGGLVALLAMVTLFGMEYSESGTAAFGLGWLGGTLIPGAIALTIAVATAVAVLYLTVAGHLAGFDHLVALFAAALARFIVTLVAPAPVPQKLRAHRLTARATLVARHAGLRAPPLKTR